MKLSNQEIKLLQKLRGARSRRQKASLVILVFIGALSISGKYLGWFPENVYLVLSIGFGLALGNVFGAFSNIRPDDKLNDLLVRYIDSDAEALEQISDAGSQPPSKAGEAGAG